jgi:hypothetical protein
MAAPKNDISQMETSPPSSENLEHQPKEHVQEDALDDDPVYSYAEQRKIIHRLDRRLITIAGVIYMNSLMDRSNLPNAGIAGMNVDLGMVTGFRYVSRSSAAS